MKCHSTLFQPETIVASFVHVTLVIYKIFIDQWKKKMFHYGFFFFCLQIPFPLFVYLLLAFRIIKMFFRLTAVYVDKIGKQAGNQIKN